MTGKRPGLALGVPGGACRYPPYVQRSTRMATMDVRTCPKCHQEKPVDTGFYKKRYRNGNGRKDGTHSRCKECLKEARRTPRYCESCGCEYFHIGSAGARRRLCDACGDIGRICSACGRYRPLDAFYKNNPYCKDSCALEYNRARLYNVSPKQYLELKTACGGACPACGRSDRPLVVDHCHDSGAVRGLLCGPCNSGMGMFGDSIDAMKGAIRYLEAAIVRSQGS